MARRFFKNLEDEVSEERLRSHPEGARGRSSRRMATAWRESARYGGEEWEAPGGGDVVRVPRAAVCPGAARVPIASGS
jgi:hypothetical protein